MRTRFKNPRSDFPNKTIYFNKYYDLASHTTYVVFVNFIHEWPDIKFVVDFERQIFEKLFMEIFIYSEFLPQVC